MKNKFTVRKIIGHGMGGLFGATATKAAALAGAGMLLAACGIFGPGEVKVCPRVSLLNDAQSMTQYRGGPGRDLTDVLFEAKVVDVNWSCKYLDNRVRVEAAIDIVAQKGPASEVSSASSTMSRTLSPRRLLPAKSNSATVAAAPACRKRLN